MKCLEAYRSKQVREANRMLRVILESPDESAIHDFRVGMKRINALYRFLAEIDGSLRARRLLKPYRGLFKRLGPVREAHIALHLIEDMEANPARESGLLLTALRTRASRDYRHFRDYGRSEGPAAIRLPTIRATGISNAGLLRHRQAALDGLIRQAASTGNRMNAAQWHGKRILLKRYHHLVDAFSGCPGRAEDERVMKGIVLLEQLLGDWHDRVVSAEILDSLPGPDANRKALAATMKKQAGQLLGSAKIYLKKLDSRIVES